MLFIFPERQRREAPRGPLFEALYVVGHARARATTSCECSLHHESDTSRGRGARGVTKSQPRGAGGWGSNFPHFLLYRHKTEDTGQAYIRMRVSTSSRRGPLAWTITRGEPRTRITQRQNLSIHTEPLTDKPHTPSRMSQRLAAASVISLYLFRLSRRCVWFNYGTLCRMS